MALVFVAAGVFGILTLGGKAGDPKETAQTTEAVDSSKPESLRIRRMLMLGKMIMAAIIRLQK